MKSSTLRDATPTPLGVPLDMPTEQVMGSAVIEILYSLTSDGPDGQPSPPPDSNTLWAVVRRVDGCTLWRAIQLAQVRSAAPDVCNFPRQQMTSQRRIPPCGRGLSSSSWCEVEIVRGGWTCLACNSIAPGKIIVPSS
jgi:hypothetical protein